ncbi:iron chaperone [Microbacterium sp. MYb62]|uniref:iron chaperone n=1 Tax=Microbacterium sp. MYb62 TaxID=1848690 RepID=UPI000CFD641E|nr:DUF1801 domain-containing protein [Microbacterium sp. MYb62]PRB11276.1 hypothetical protein CQ042_16715 [Microbacterium sp. MYb62]
MGTIDDYLSGLTPADRAAIDRVYAVARQEVPDAEQGKGYGMPALVHGGKALLSVMRAKKHIGIYPFSPDAVSAVAGLLERHPGVSVDKGTIRFQPEHPIPSDVLEALVRARLSQIDGA